MLECVVNVSEGQKAEVIEAIASAAGADLLDVHSDPDHHRSVLTVIGEDAPRKVTRAAVSAIDLRRHHGAHPRIGAVDVVPFIPLGDAAMIDAIRARDRFAAWASETFGLPCFFYGPERSLPDLRRAVRAGSAPDVGPASPHPTAGAIAVGARPVLVAYNLWLTEADLDLAQSIAAGLRSPVARTMAFAVGNAVQVSANLIDPLQFGPADLFDAVAARTAVARAELVGLMPRAVLERIPSSRWTRLDLAEDRTIESRLGAA